MKWLFALATATLLGIGGSALAAFGIFQTYAVPVVPQIFYNIVTDGGASCPGDVQTLTRTVSITGGQAVLTTSASTFSSGDVGKYIIVPGAGFSGNTMTSTISSYQSATQVTLANNAFTTLSSVSSVITFGTDAAPAFKTFNTWAQANQGSNQVVLTVPAGSNCWFGSNQVVTGPGGNISGNAFAAYVKNLIVEGTGATLNGVGGSGYTLGGLGTCFQGLTATPGCTARVQSVSAGATTISLTSESYAAGYISRFSVGDTILIGGIDPQSLFSPDSGYGDPVNLWAFEWKKITAICNNTGACPGAAVITIDSPLADSYSALWPQYNPGDQFRSDSGGPATIWKIHPSWETTIEYRGLTISQSGQTYGRGRSLTYRNVTFTGANGGIPTENESFSAINTDYGLTNMETDKLVGTMLFDGVTISKVVSQSTATKRFIVRNSTVTLGLDGGAQYTEISDSTLANWKPGIFAYGSLRPTDVTICTRCTIGGLDLGFGAISATGQAYWTMSGGVITMPNAAADGSDPGQRYFVPGALVYYAAAGTNPPISFGCCETIGSFQVTTITGDPWPALDNQTLTTTINITSGSKNLNVPSGPFVSGDVGKTILVNGARSGGGRLSTWITGYTSATDVTLYSPAGTTVAGSQTIQWGTSNTYINTNQAGAFPSVSALSTSPIKISSISVPNFTCDQCNSSNQDSDAYAVSLQAGATATKPLGSYYSRTYTPSTTGGMAQTRARGIFKKLRINVTTPSTAAGSNTMTGNQFNWFMIDKSTPSAPAPYNWLPSNLVINLKQAGDRVITPSGVTCNGSPGACSGDTINLPPNLATMWIMNPAVGPYINGAFTTPATFTMTLETDPLQ